MRRKGEHATHLTYEIAPHSYIIEDCSAIGDVSGFITLKYVLNLLGDAGEQASCIASNIQL